MENLALIINLAVFGLYTFILFGLSIDEAKKERKKKENIDKAEPKKAA